MLYCFKTFICFRSAAVDSNGREFNRNRLIALMSSIVLEEVFVYLLSEEMLSFISKSGLNSFLLLSSILAPLLLQTV